jgi:hypothetical protein
MKTMVSGVNTLVRALDGTSRKLIALCVVSLFLFSILPFRTKAAAGDLDFTFGNGGKELHLADNCVRLETQTPRITPVDANEFPGDFLARLTLCGEAFRDTIPGDCPGLGGGGASHSHLSRRWNHRRGQVGRPLCCREWYSREPCRLNEPSSMPQGQAPSTETLETRLHPCS